MDLELVEQSRGEALADRARAASDVHPFVAGCRLRLLDGAFDRVHGRKGRLLFAQSSLASWLTTENGPNIHSRRRPPSSSIGFSGPSFGRATNPSSDIEMSATTLPISALSFPEAQFCASALRGIVPEGPAIPA
jgi:hypothetical protein